MWEAQTPWLLILGCWSLVFQTLRFPQCVHPLQRGLVPSWPREPHPWGSDPWDSLPTKMRCGLIYQHPEREPSAGNLGRPVGMAGEARHCPRGPIGGHHLICGLTMVMVIFLAPSACLPLDIYFQPRGGDQKELLSHFTDFQASQGLPGNPAVNRPLS